MIYDALFDLIRGVHDLKPDMVKTTKPDTRPHFRESERLLKKMYKSFAIKSPTWICIASMVFADTSSKTWSTKLRKKPLFAFPT